MTDLYVEKQLTTSMVLNEDNVHEYWGTEYEYLATSGGSIGEGLQ